METVNFCLLRMEGVILPDVVDSLHKEAVFSRVEIIVFDYRNHKNNQFV